MKDKNEISSAKISLCQCLTLCFGGRSAMEQLTVIIDVFSPEDSARENKQRGGMLVGQVGCSYRSHHLQVLQIRALGGQQLLGDEVGPVRWEPLQRHPNRAETVSKINLMIQPVFVVCQLCCLTHF